VNIHPSLLPAFGGTLHAQAAALAHGVKVSGCTVHLVDDTVDGGPIVAQAAVPVREDDTEETLAARILAEEHRLLPRVLGWFVEGRIRREGRRIRIAPVGPGQVTGGEERLTPGSDRPGWSS
jgi:phosphoribosylglycinamide formyltransferase-1